jgi:tetratricopeptide (TPR) repeat protein
VARAGLVRFPESNVLRELLRALLDRAGRPEVLCETADWIAALRPDSAASAWYAGHARFLWAEWARRAGRAEGAIAQYDAATERFARSVELEPAYADSAGHYLAMAEMGRGFAHRIAGRRQDAADALVRALARRPVVGDARDALDREALDLVDAVLEWTEIDGESRVNAVAFADALSRAVPGEARWLRAVSDTCLREGLRADGRMGTTVPVPTEMRAEGQPAELRTPCAGGDRWLGLSIEIAARARAVSDDPDSRRYEAQARAVHAERLLVTGRDSEAEKLLEEAARLLDELARPEETLHGLARRLRTRLGDARPVARPGR